MCVMQGYSIQILFFNKWWNLKCSFCSLSPTRRFSSLEVFNLYFLSACAASVALAVTVVTVWCFNPLVKLSIKIWVRPALNPRSHIRPSHAGTAMLETSTDEKSNACTLTYMHRFNSMDVSIFIGSKCLEMVQYLELSPKSFHKICAKWMLYNFLGSLAMCC